MKKNDYCLKIIKVVLLIISSLFIFVGIPLIINESYKLNCGYRTLWKAEDVLSYYAELLSSCITIGSIIATVYYAKKDTEKQIKASQSQTNPPFFVVKEIKDDGLINSSHSISPCRKKYVISKTGQKMIHVSLENVGEGIAVQPNYVSAENDVSTPNKYVAPKMIWIIDHDISCAIDALSTGDTPSYNQQIVISYFNTFGIKYTQNFHIQYEFLREENSIEINILGISSQDIVQ